MQKERSKKILIINDSPTLNALLELTLEAEGFSVTVAETGLSGLKKAEKEEFNLILLDYLLPDISGIEVCRRLRKEQVTKSTTIAFVSATDKDEILKKIKKAGGDTYIDPPFTGEVFLDKINDLITSN